MSKTVVYEVQVMFGDCDPAGIVFFPNFSKWMDASSLNFFVKCGVAPWRELVKTRGIIGTPHLTKKFRDEASIHLEKLGKNTMPAGSQSPNITCTS